MNLETLKELYVSELRDLYNAENQLVKALPKMAKGASSDELKDAFEKHLEQTKGHVQSLDREERWSRRECEGDGHRHLQRQRQGREDNLRLSALG
jgi:ferritin-like metal-binding protein YciE